MADPETSPPVVGGAVAASGVVVEVVVVVGVEGVTRIAVAGVDSGTRRSGRPRFITVRAWDPTTRRAVHEGEAVLGADCGGSEGVKYRKANQSEDKLRTLFLLEGGCDDNKFFYFVNFEGKYVI